MITVDSPMPPAVRARLAVLRGGPVADELERQERLTWDVLLHQLAAQLQAVRPVVVRVKGRARVVVWEADSTIRLRALKLALSLRGIAVKRGR